MKTALSVCLALFLMMSVLPSLAQAGSTWVKDPGNPVLDVGAPGAWDDSRVVAGPVILESGVYRMWYTGWDGTVNVHFQVGLATSSDGVNWTREATNPVLALGSPGTWDDESVAQAAVIKDGGVYKMWYSGNDGSVGRIGYATSTDGISWNKDSLNNPVLEPDVGQWDGNFAHMCTVIKDGSTYKMWYSGANDFMTSHRIGYATSTDGITWVKYAGNPVLEPVHAGTWDDVQVWFPYVVKEGSTYRMWYGGYDGYSTRIGYATSLDGISWQVQDDNPVLDLGGSGEWDETSVLSPCLLPPGPYWKMWYQGFDASGTGRAGYATLTSSVPAASGWTLVTLVLVVLAGAFLLLRRSRAPERARP
jgi:predicted GH43/DUF377 family glycosyl hydrolase